MFYNGFILLSIFYTTLGKYIHSWSKKNEEYKIVCAMFNVYFIIFMYFYAYMCTVKCKHVIRPNYILKQQTLTKIIKIQYWN